MPDTYRVIYTSRAASQLQDIFEYIALDSPGNAAKMIGRLLDAADSLNALPHRYNLARNIGNAGQNIRCMVVRPYLIRYKIDEKRQAVAILSVSHGARRDGF